VKQVERKGPSGRGKAEGAYVDRIGKIAQTTKGEGENSDEQKEGINEVIAFVGEKQKNPLGEFPQSYLGALERGDSDAIPSLV